MFKQMSWSDNANSFLRQNTKVGRFMHVTVLCGHSWFPWEGLSNPFAFRGAAGKLFMKNAGVAEF